MGREIEPPLPPYVDLRSFNKMDLDVIRFLNSRAISFLSDQAFRPWLRFILESWHQLPASSLPSDDHELASLAGFARDVEQFKSVKNEALYGWILCSDQRYYHPVVAEMAANAWESKIKRAYRDYRGGCKLKKTEPLDIAAWRPTHELSLLENANADAENPFRRVSGGFTARRRRDDGATTARRRRDDGATTARRPQRDLTCPDLSCPDLSTNESVEPLKDSRRVRKRTSTGKSTETWEAYSSAFRERYQTAPKRNARINAQLAKLVDYVGSEDAPLVARFYLKLDSPLYTSAMHTVDLLLRDYQKITALWETDMADPAMKRPSNFKTKQQIIDERSEAAAQRWLASHGLDPDGNPLPGHERKLDE